MRLIIDIPNSLYANLAKIRNGSNANKRILDSVKSGIPLDDVLDKISTEIDEKISHYEHFLSSNTANGLMIAKEIINKYKAESEDKE